MIPNVNIAIHACYFYFSVCLLKSNASSALARGVFANIHVACKVNVSNQLFHLGEINAARNKNHPWDPLGVFCSSHLSLACKKCTQKSCSVCVQLINIWPKVYY